MQKKPIIGIMTLSLARERKDLALKFHQIAVEKLKRCKDIEIIENKQLCLDTLSTLSTARDLENKGSDCILMIGGTWIYAPMVITPAQNMKIPFALWGIASEEAFSLVGAAIAHGSLDEVGIPHKYLYGSPDNKNVIRAIVSFARAAKVVKQLRGSVLGVFGGRSAGMYTAMVDPSQVKRLFGVEIEHRDQYQIILEAKRIPQLEVDKLYNWTKVTYGNIEANQEIMEKSIRVYLSLKKIKKREKFDFLTVKCQPELIDNYASACLANSLLIDEGIVSSCECDINAALTMQILHLLSNSAVMFADLNAICREDNSIRLVNCGSAPTTLAKDRKSVNLFPQYSYMGKKGGVTTTFWTKDGQVTLARLFRIKGNYTLQIAAGQSIEQPRDRLAEARERWPQAYIKLNTDDIERFIQACRSNHMHMVYGNYVQELKEVTQILGLETEIA
jgi:L-fucose isomerase